MDLVLDTKIIVAIIGAFTSIMVAFIGKFTFESKKKKNVARKVSFFEFIKTVGIGLGVTAFAISVIALMRTQKPFLEVVTEEISISPNEPPSSLNVQPAYKIPYFNGGNEPVMEIPINIECPENYVPIATWLESFVTKWDDRKPITYELWSKIIDEKVIVGTRALDNSSGYEYLKIHCLCERKSAF